MSLANLIAMTASAELRGCGPEGIVKEAIQLFKPVKVFAGFSGGDDSLVTTHWMMNNVPGCEVFHANTGIGIERTRQFVRETCARYGWPLHEIRAKEDCGQDYDALVIERGFPGPGHHYKMFQRLKERCAEKLLRDAKKKRTDKVMLATGIRQDESLRRAGYHYSVIDLRWSLMWVNPFYYRTKDWFRSYIAEHKIPRNPVSEQLGMSGECLCGAYAHKGELALIKQVCPETHARIIALQEKVFAAGHSWGWEEEPPKKKRCRQVPGQQFMPFCVGCEKQDDSMPEQELERLDDTLALVGLERVGMPVRLPDEQNPHPGRGG